MKYLKILGLAAVAAAALMAFVGAGTASATSTLCKATPTPCEHYDLGTTIVGHSITTPESTGNPHIERPTLTGSPFGNISCNSTITGTIDTTTTPEGSVSAANLTWSECKNGTATTVTGGKMQVHWDAEHNGNVTISGFVVKVVQAGITCYYGGNLEGTLTGGSSPVLHVTTGVSKITTAPHSSSGFCPTNATWHATYTVTQPLYVEDGV